MRKLKRTYVHYWAQHQWRQCVACRYCHYTCRGQLKYDGTRTETRFRLSAKRASLFKSLVGGVSSVGYWQPRCAASAVVMLDTPCSEVVWRVLATHCIRQFPLHFPSRASPCAITFQLESYHLQYKMQLTPSTVPGPTHFIPCLFYGTLRTGIPQPVASSVTTVSLLCGFWCAMPQVQLYSFTVSKSVLVENMKAHKACRGIAPLIFNLSTRQKWVFSITPWPHYSRKR